MGGQQQLEQYVRAADYLTVAQIFLRDNFLLERELVADDIKPRLLGHWGSGPGVNFIYAHLNRAINQHELNMLFVLGPGHAFPSLQANLFLEESLLKFYPQATHTPDGIGYICRDFSWPHGFPSHSNPGTPGVILEGGELGYSLATAYGSVLDNPDLITACVIGDGEAETGPLNGAWHLNKLVNPKTSGNVLPILHLNGYKISGPTVYGRMSNDELKSLFWGLGYEPMIVEGDGIHQQMSEALDRAVGQFQHFKTADQPVSPRSPLIVLKTPKGWHGIKQLNGRKVEGNFASHQVVLTEAKTDPGQLRALEDWLRSYRFHELFSPEAGFNDDIRQLIPNSERKMGQNRHAHGGESVYRPLKLPTIEFFAEDATTPGTIGSSSMRRAGLYLNEVFKLNQAERNFRLMSPDETYSNKLDQVFESTARAWQWPREPWDEDMDPDGRVMEILSEHDLQGLAQGYVLTGRHAVFASYEAFIQVIVSMVDQYAKFIGQSSEFAWRGDFPSLNYILTSSGWRQEHNGFSHQNPGFIDDILQRQGNFVNVYFPPDGNTMLAVLERTLSSQRQINVIASGKTLEPRWLTPALARRQLDEGIMVWDFASDDDPDVVLAAAGEYLVKESLAAISLLKASLPGLRLRFVCIGALSCPGLGDSRAGVDKQRFETCFTSDKPVVCNFHGYPQTLKQILFDLTPDTGRFSVHGYIESGSTTTPFDMHVRNRTSRYHLAMDVLRRAGDAGAITPEQASQHIAGFEQKLAEHTDFIKTHGVDQDDIENWQWTPSS